MLTPELMDALYALLTQNAVLDETNIPHALPSPEGEQQASKDEQKANIAQNIRY